MMKKSTFGVALAFIAAAAGVLTAGAPYLRRREKELDGYGQVLYAHGDFDGGGHGPTYEPIQDVAPAAETDPGAEGAAQ